MASYTATPVVDASGKVAGKFLGAVFLSMAAALLVSALTSIGVSYLFIALYGAGNGLTVEGYTNLTWTLVGSAIFMFIYMLVTSRMTRFYVVHLTVFSLWVGIILSALLLTGLSFEIAGEGLLISAFAFLSMFLIGYFTKINSGILSMLGFGLLAGAFGLLVISLITFWMGTFSWMNLLAQGLILFAVLLFTAVDARRMKQLAMAGHPNFNLVMACAYALYGDFVNIFLRIIYFLMLTRSRS